MNNFLADLVECIGDEPVEAVVFNGPLYSWRSDPDPRDAGIDFERVYSWKEAQPLLNYEYDAGYGGADCHFVNIWTPTRVIYIHEYDGSTTPSSEPRNPPTKD